MITIETTAENTRVTIPRNEVPPEQLVPFLDWSRLEATARRSDLSEAEADRLAEGIKADWWAKNKSRFIASAEA